MLMSIMLVVGIFSADVFECGLSANSKHDKIWRPFPENAPKSPTSKMIRMFIVGGTRALEGAWPWYTLIKYRSLNDGKLYICGGSLISANHVLTAAHCAVEMSVEDTNVSIGTTLSGIKVLPEITYNLKKKFIYSKYSANMEKSPRQLHDIAILQLSTQVQFTEHRRPISISSPPSYLANISAYVTGFGAYNVGDDIGTSISDYLQQTRLPLLTKEACSQRWRKLKSYGGGFDIASTQLCAGSLGHGTAQGDSGGPLMIRNDEGQWYQIGITSFGINTGPGYYDQNMAPGIYTRVSSYCEFISSSTNGEVPCDSGNYHLRTLATFMLLLTASLS
ncbi:hypothetical protein RB195_001991 [Necator americanus]|uniref:Peptidase S1 domain-containing protein n=1 Tax=Necator americanus TaxID=51031 RepID=A0ABR1DIB7_NECAM